MQGALNYAMQTSPRRTPVTINVKNGSVRGTALADGKDNVTIKGESRDGVLISLHNYDTLNPGTGGSQARARRPTGTPAAAAR